MRTKRRKQLHYNKHNQIKIEVKSAAVLRVLSLSKHKYSISRCCFVSDKPCFTHEQLAISLQRVERSVKCICQRFCLVNVQK